jgi:hypothetical protein
LSGFTFELYQDEKAGNGVFDGTETMVAMTTSMKPDGEYWFTDLFLGTYFVREAEMADWVQTAGDATIEVTTSGDVHVAETGQGDPLDDFQQELSIVASLAFGNFQLFDIHGIKFEDVVKDGVRDENGVDDILRNDDDEVTLEGWEIQLYKDLNNDGVADENELIDTMFTDANGDYWFTDLGPGTYLLREVQQDFWRQSTADPAPIVGRSSQDVYDIDFGNHRLGKDGHTRGFWHNVDGQALITQDDVDFLATLNLVNADGTPFNPTTKEELIEWLTINSNSTNMANTLSVQLAAMWLNVSHDFVDPTNMILAPGTMSADGDGIATLLDVMNEANAALQADQMVEGGDSNRGYFGALITAIDDANNNLNWIC